MGPVPALESVVRPWSGLLYFEPGTWDGSDVFAPEGTTLTFMTQDVGRAIEHLKPTNALIQQLSEITQMR